MQSHDSAGQWVIWKLRDDWQRTSIGMTLDAAPAVKYVVYRNAGNPDARVIEQMNHNLDVINDIAPEGMFTIARAGRRDRRRTGSTASRSRIPTRRCRR